MLGGVTALPETSQVLGVEWRRLFSLSSVENRHQSCHGGAEPQAPPVRFQKPERGTEGSCPAGLEGAGTAGTGVGVGLGPWRGAPALNGRCCTRGAPRGCRGGEAVRACGDAVLSGPGRHVFPRLVTRRRRLGDRCWSFVLLRLTFQKLLSNQMCLLILGHKWVAG